MPGVLTEVKTLTKVSITVTVSQVQKGFQSKKCPTCLKKFEFKTRVCLIELINLQPISQVS